MVSDVPDTYRPDMQTRVHWSIVTIGSRMMTLSRQALAAGHSQHPSHDAHSQRPSDDAHPSSIDVDRQLTRPQEGQADKDDVRLWAQTFSTEA